MKIRDILYHLQAVLLLPFVAIVVIPAAILVSANATQLIWLTNTYSDLLITLFSILMIGIGLALLVHTVFLFATFGKGTLAPWAPTKKLVVRGAYRYMRHPMISGVFLVLLGEAGLWRVSGLLTWALLFQALNMVYLPLVEDPGLEKRFGAPYRAYKKNVPAWIPRAKPWSPAT